MTTTAPAPLGHERGTPGFRRLGLAMWCCGMATFVLVYAVQGVLPVLATEFGVSSGTSSLALSATTLTLALAVVPLSAVAESWGRARVMTIALTASAILGLLAPLSPTFAVLVGIRALQGVALAALPALAMAHVSREVAAHHLGGAMGLFIAGNTIGGLSSRIVSTAVADVAGWRIGLLAVGVVSLVCTVGFRLLLPPSIGPATAPVRLRELGPQLRLHLRDPGLRCLFGIGALLMGTFVTVYNYLGFRLLAEPFGLPAGLVALIFLGYLAGSYSSTVAGTLGDRFGRRRMLWTAMVVGLAGLWLTAPDLLVTVLVGTVVVTVGFFAGHSLASGWVGRRSSMLPGGSPGIASSLYLFCYYAGSSVGGTVGGVAYDHGGWPGLLVFTSALLLVALALALRLRRVPAP